MHCRRAKVMVATAIKPNELMIAMENHATLPLP